jgi:hypothetical protein
VEICSAGGSPRAGRDKHRQRWTNALAALEIATRRPQTQEGGPRAALFTQQIQSFGYQVLPLQPPPVPEHVRETVPALFSIANVSPLVDVAVTLYEVAVGVPVTTT